MLDNSFEFLLNFSMYHKRWSELTEEDFKNMNQYEKGAESRINVEKPNKTTFTILLIKGRGFNFAIVNK